MKIDYIVIPHRLLHIKPLALCGSQIDNKTETDKMESQKGKTFIHFALKGVGVYGECWNSLLQMPSICQPTDVVSLLTQSYPNVRMYSRWLQSLRRNHSLIRVDWNVDKEPTCWSIWANCVQSIERICWTCHIWEAPEFLKCLSVFQLLWGPIFRSSYTLNFVHIRKLWPRLSVFQSTASANWCYGSRR